jgi:hypothetical protein
MRTRSITILAVAVLGLAACSNDQGDVADAAVEQAADLGMSLDEACVTPIAEQLSDEDVKSLEEGSDVVTSPEGEILIGRMMIECASAEDIVEGLLADLPDDGSVDKMCIAEAMKTADLSAGMDQAMIEAMTPCVGG